MSGASVGSALQFQRFNRKVCIEPVFVRGNQQTIRNCGNDFIEMDLIDFLIDLVNDSKCSNDLPSKSSHLPGNDNDFIVLELIDLHGKFKDDSDVDLQNINRDFQISCLLDVAACVSFGLASVHAACPTQCRACLVCVDGDVVGLIDVSVFPVSVSALPQVLRCSPVSFASLLLSAFFLRLCGEVVGGPPSLVWCGGLRRLCFQSFCSFCCSSLCSSLSSSLGSSLSLSLCVFPSPCLVVSLCVRLCHSLSVSLCFRLCRCWSVSPCFRQCHCLSVRLHVSQCRCPSVGLRLCPLVCPFVGQAALCPRPCEGGPVRLADHVFQYVSRFVCQSVCQCVRQSVCQSVCQSLSQSLYPSFCLGVFCFSLSPSICPLFRPVACRSVRFLFRPSVCFLARLPVQVHVSFAVCFVPLFLFLFLLACCWLKKGFKSWSKLGTVSHVVIVLVTYINI